MSENIRAALTEIYMARRLDIKQFLSARLGSAEEAEDVVQDLFLKIQNMKPSSEIRNGEAFLYKIASNLAIDRYRQRQRARAREEKWAEESHQKIGTEWISERPSAEESADSKARLNKLVMALQDLPPQARRVFVLHKFDGLSHRAVAERLKISRSTVEKHMITALKRLTHLRDSADG